MTPAQVFVAAAVGIAGGLAMILTMADAAQRSTTGQTDTPYRHIVRLALFVLGFATLVSVLWWIR